MKVFIQQQTQKEMKNKEYIIQINISVTAKILLDTPNRALQ